MSTSLVESNDSLFKLMTRSMLQKRKTRKRARKEKRVEALDKCEGEVEATIDRGKAAADQAELWTPLNSPQKSNRTRTKFSPLPASSTALSVPFLWLKDEQNAQFLRVKNFNTANTVKENMNKPQKEVNPSKYMKKYLEPQYLSLNGDAFEVVMGSIQFRSKVSQTISKPKNSIHYFPSSLRITKCSEISSWHQVIHDSR